MLQDDYVTFEIGKAKHIALVAHDGKKKEQRDFKRTFSLWNRDDIPVDR